MVVVTSSMDTRLYPPLFSFLSLPLERFMRCFIPIIVALFLCHILCLFVLLLLLPAGDNPHHAGLPAAWPLWKEDAKWKRSSAEQ